jgi:hypothetical protein
MKYAVEMASGGITIGSDVRKLLGCTRAHTQGKAIS